MLGLLLVLQLAAGCAGAPEPVEAPVDAVTVETVPPEQTPALALEAAGYWLGAGDATLAAAFLNLVPPDTSDARYAALVAEVWSLPGRADPIATEHCVQAGMRRQFLHESEAAALAGVDASVDGAPRRARHLTGVRRTRAAAGLHLSGGRPRDRARRTGRPSGARVADRSIEEVAFLEVTSSSLEALELASLERGQVRLVGNPELARVALPPFAEARQLA